MTVPSCSICGQPTAGYDPESETKRPLCAECCVARHDRRRLAAAFPTTVYSTDGRQSFSVATKPDGWGLSFDVRELDAETKPTPLLTFRKRRKP